MIKVGLTGGIGSGKTIVAKVFEQLNVPVFYADEEAKRLLYNDEEIIKQLRDRFGDSIFDENGINKASLASLIFNDSIALRDVNRIIHPRVRKEFANWAEQQTSPYVIMEAAILFESGGHKNMDYSILVYAPEDLRIQRVVERDNTTAEQVKARMRNQDKDEDKINKADWVLYNDGVRMILPQIIEIHNQIKAKN
jgi:dephospho-CoA kinase